jgi:hypothetical protein
MRYATSSIDLAQISDTAVELNADDTTFNSESMQPRKIVHRVGGIASTPAATYGDPLAALEVFCGVECARDQCTVFWEQ